MTEQSSANPSAQGEFSRVIGRYGAASGGPIMVAVGGLHGNEPTGCLALERVFARLEAQEVPFLGTLVGLSGNVGALRLHRRYIELDLNRIWTQERIESTHQEPLSSLPAEVKEQRELLALFEELFAQGEGVLTVLDLHTSSSPSVPFGIVGESPMNRSFAKELPLAVPLVYGLDAQFDGPMLKYLGLRGHKTLAFEAGQHEDPLSIDLHEALLWVMLTENGHISQDDNSAYEASLALLHRAAGDVPPHHEVFYRHAITPTDGFVMEPGFSNFDPIEEGGLLAQEREGEVRASEDARVLLPLYQAQGNDGFFLLRELN